MLSKIRDRQARFLAAHVENSLRSSSHPSFLDPSLPGPSRRVYATSTTPAHAPVAAAAMRQRPAHSPTSTNNHGLNGSIAQGVFAKRPPMVMLPTPLPEDEHAPMDQFYFPRTSAQETLNIIEACMFRGHDMPRARKLLDSMRSDAAENRSVPVEVSLYNQFIVTYFDLASATEDNTTRENLVKEAWSVYRCIQEDGVDPDYTTYAAVLLILSKFSPFAEKTVPSETHSSNFPQVLASISDRALSIPFTIERLFAYFDVPDSERKYLMTHIQQWAVANGQATVLLELGKLSLKEPVEDPIAGIPLVNPVKKQNIQVPWRKAKADFDADQTPFNLDNLRSSMSHLIDARKHLADDPLSRQKLVEEGAVEDAKERLEHEFTRLEAQGLANIPGMKNSRSMQKWMWEWYLKLVPRIEEAIGAIVENEKAGGIGLNKPRRTGPSVQDRNLLSPFLTLLKPHQLAILTIMEVLRLHGSGGVSEGMKTARALITIGMAVEQEWSAALRKREMGRRANLEKFYSEETNLQDSTVEALDDEMPTSARGLESIHARRRAAKLDAEVEGPPTPEWSRAIQAKVGSILVDALMETATVVRSIAHPETGEIYSEEQPAFNHEYEYMRGRKLGVIKLNPEVLTEFTRGGSASTLHPRHLPMFVTPRPWVGPGSGAYFYNRSNVMRIKDSLEQSQYLSEASGQGNLELIYASLDVLGSTPWVINKDIFEVVLETWNSGEGLADIPPANLDLPDPEKPADYDTNDVVKKNYLISLKETINKRRNNHSDRCNVNYKLEIARAFLPDKFYFPHNLDFRGRAYPIPPHLNHIGNDLSRGLLKFADKRPLGVAGLRWLKIHLANVWGFDKASFDEREEWTMQRLEQVRDSAQNPLKGNRFWISADDPWQCLATCMELTKALELEDPTKFESNLPVHQDGTCNGLQHYAALGGDSVGAQQVNLSVTERPSDVYTYVANMVEKTIEKDILKGNEAAKLLKGRIARKVVKQTVMTTVYGVTFVGARAQIEKQLRERGDLDRDQLWLTSSYLARATLNCIADLFSGAKAIQNWLSLVARLISKSIPPERVEVALAGTSEESTKRKTATAKKHGFTNSRAAVEQMTSVIWTTPMGLPIVQPYRKLKRKQLMTPTQSVYIGDPNLQTQVNPMKQSSAFPPNFIHSLDATHMMLTSLECRRHELSFASVHDSYWTHACSVDEMSGIIRDTFVFLHSSDVMGKLLAEFRERYKGYRIPVASLNEREINSINEVTDTKILFKGNSRIKKSARRGSALHLPNPVEPSEDLAEFAEDAEGNDATIDLDAEVEIITPRSIAEDAKAPETSEDGRKTWRKRGDAIPVTRQYVDLIDVLPILPAKGNFSVETIRKSLYFFS